jgi:tetratricopeptide (TPR) repeat protein
MMTGLASTVLMALCLAQAHSHTGTAAPATLMAGLGSHRHAIVTKSPEAQRFFDQGLTLLYGFNHGQAIKQFQRAAELDPSAPMPLWGIALAYGPNINDFEMDRERAKTADGYVRRALALTSPGQPKERAYVEALAKRYSSDPAADLKKLQVDYKDAMAALARAYPDDLDAQVLYAESLMDLRPWQLWTRDGQPADVTPDVIRVLESVLRRNPKHPGANHYYIHTMEASPTPQKALAAARQLETLVPAAGHLVHMPAHIYARTGDFVASANSNAAAAGVDEKYMAAIGTRTGFYPLMYYNHNLHFESYAAAMAGQYARAERLASKLTANVGPALADMPMLEGFMPQQYYVRLRFAKWDELLALPEPASASSSRRRSAATRARPRTRRRRISRARAASSRRSSTASRRFRPRRPSASSTPPARCSRSPGRWSRAVWRRPKAGRRRRWSAIVRRWRQRTCWPTTSRPRGTTRYGKRSAPRSSRTANRPRPSASSATI